MIISSKKEIGYEDTSLYFRINISTVDIIKPNLTIYFNTQYGNLSTTDSTINTIESTKYLYFICSFSECSNALANLVYNPPSNWNGYDDIEMVLNTSYGMTTHDWFVIQIQAVNDNITISQPNGLSYTVWEDEPLYILDTYVTDIDCEHHWQHKIKVNITVNRGSVSLGNNIIMEGLYFGVGSENSQSYIEFEGGLTYINRALKFIKYEPPLHYFGNDFVIIYVDDQGYTGVTGESYTDYINISIVVTSTPDRPTFTKSNDAICDEDTYCYVLNGGYITDVDSTIFQVTLSIDTGYYQLNETNGLSFTQGNGVNDTNTILNGTANDIYAALKNITVYPPLNWNGHITLTMTATDLDTQPITHDIDIHVIAINDAPTMTVSSMYLFMIICSM